MQLSEFIENVVCDGIESAKQSYADPKDADKLKGAIEGFELCRGIDHPAHLLEALQKANDRAQEAFRAQAVDYWRWRCRAAEIEWVCNVVSGAIHAECQGTLGAMWPTARGLEKAIEIILENG